MLICSAPRSGKLSTFDFRLVEGDFPACPTSPLPLNCGAHFQVEKHQEKSAMPKMKRHKGLMKRIKVSAGGKVRYNKSGAGHLMSGKSSSRRRSMRKHLGLLNPQLAKRMRRMVGAG